MESILQQFLSAQIINIDEDENHEKLLKACGDLTKILSKDKAKLQKVAISAFDPTIDIDDPNLVETKNLIIKHWSTFINKCQNMPLTYIRAVMLESLQTLSSEQDLAAIIWLSAEIPSRYYILESREKPLLAELLTTCAEKYEKVGIERWSVSGTIASVAIKVPTMAETKELPGIENNYIVEKLKAASVNSAIVHNPSYGTFNTNQEWVNGFSKIAGEGINELFAAIIKQTNESLETKANLDIFESFIESFNDQISAIFNKLIDRSVSTELRGQLLWFKEALYSTTQKNSYRKLTIEIAAVVMPYEFAKLVPEYCPVSTEFFLEETLLLADPLSREEVSLEMVFDLLISNAAKLKPYFNNYNTVKPGRSSLLAFIGYLVNGLQDKSAFNPMTGLMTENKVSWSDLSIWLYREFQVVKLINKK